MQRSLTGTVAWVTGAGSGIGQAGARVLATAGAVVVLSGRRPEPLTDTAAAIAQAGGKAECLALDIADAGAVSAAAQAILARHGRLDILVNNAGINIKNRRWNQLTPEAWRQVVEVNLNGPVYCAQAALPAMRRQRDGLIINVASWAGRFPSYVSGAAYTASKHAMLAMNYSLNVEEFQHGIRACCILPAEVATPILDQRPVVLPAEERARMLQPEDLGETILFVARMPAHVCLNEILISPTWNRAFLGEPDRFPPRL
ncbi:MAG: SDR family oxidoreductase [Alphaproteobacteria bacterium]|nr:SDR family oxidoreductase [Alphaproteobacteria bacterium]